MEVTMQKNIFGFSNFKHFFFGQQILGTGREQVVRTGLPRCLSAIPGWD